MADPTVVYLCADPLRHKEIGCRSGRGLYDWGTEGCVPIFGLNVREDLGSDHGSSGLVSYLELSPVAKEGLDVGLVADF